MPVEPDSEFWVLVCEQHFGFPSSKFPLLSMDEVWDLEVMPALFAMLS